VAAVGEFVTEVGRKEGFPEGADGVVVDGVGAVGMGGIVGLNVVEISVG